MSRATPRAAAARGVTFALGLVVALVATSVCVGLAIEAVPARRTALIGAALLLALTLAACLYGLIHEARALLRRLSPLSHSATEAWQDLRKRLAHHAPASDAAGPRQFQQLTQAIPNPIAYFNREETCLFANEALQALLGHVPGDTTPLDLRTVLGAAEYARHAGQLQAGLTGTRATLEWQPQGADGRTYAVQLIPDFDSDMTPQGLSLIAFEITQGPQAGQPEKDDADSHRYLRSIADNVPMLVSYVDRDERVQFANAAFKTWLNKDPALMIGKLQAEVLGEAMYNARRPYLLRGLAGERLSFNSVTPMPNGSELHTSATYVPDIRPDGSVAGIFVLVTDVTSLKVIEKELEHLAKTDTLTHLANRRLLEEKLRDGLARLRRDAATRLALLLLDIDHFKAINDAHGHPGGDAVLVEFARRLRSAVRTNDTVARFAGDEFVVLLEGVDGPDEAALVARKILAAIRLPMPVAGEPLAVTASIGIALSASGDEPPENFLARADVALYEAKRAGRNTFSIGAT